MFHFPGFAPPSLCIQLGVPEHYSRRVSPFGNPRINACLAAPQGLSQLATSFIASYGLGIHRMPLVAWSPQSRCCRGQGPARLFGRQADPKLLHFNTEYYTQRELNLPCIFGFQRARRLVERRNLVELIGIEPTTSSLQSWRSPN
jgi:hypothetical protein